MSRNILVTGSSRGIGAAIARVFAENGDNVTLNCKTDTKRMGAIVDELTKLNPNIRGVCADVGNYDEAEAMFAETGGVDILINNAGISHIGLFQNMQPEEWEEIVRVNLFSVINCTRLAVPYMLRMHSGCIINISSIWGECGASCEVIYSASKGAVNAFTRGLAKELGPSGIRVNAISCGIIDTEMNEFLGDEEKAALVSTIPVGRFGEVNDIAKLAFFLASDNAAFITGQVLRADGGMI